MFQSYTTVDTIEYAEAAVDSIILAPASDDIKVGDISIKDILEGKGNNAKDFSIGSVYVPGGLDKYTEGIQQSQIPYIDDIRNEGRKEDLKVITAVLLLGILLVFFIVKVAKKQKAGKKEDILDKYINEQNQTIEKVVKINDIIAKYNTLIDGIIHWSNGKAKILNQSADRVNLGYSYEDNSVTFSISCLPSSGEIGIQWLLRSKEFGNHIYDWGFSKDKGQFEMMEVIKNDLNNYINSFLQSNI